jgi:hypothetical protein
MGRASFYFGDCQRESFLAATAEVAVPVADKHHRVIRRGAHRPSVSGSREVPFASFAMRKAQFRGQKRFGNGYNTKPGGNRLGRGSEFAGLGFRCNDNAGSRYLLLQSVSASAASR